MAPNPQTAFSVRAATPADEPEVRALIAEMMPGVDVSAGAGSTSAAPAGAR